MTAYPELVGTRSDITAGPWTISEGSARRGEASCNVNIRHLVVPFGKDETSRVVRAHELMHAKVSPAIEQFTTALEKCSPEALQVAEECRVNELLRRSNFRVELLVDGSEFYGAMHAASGDRWSDSVRYLFAVLATGAEREYFKGIRKGKPEWLPALRVIKRRAQSILADIPTCTMTSTALLSSGRAEGFEATTIALAKLCDRATSARAPIGAEDLRRFKRSMESGGRRPPSGAFAELVWLDEPDLARYTAQRYAKRKLAATTGTVVRSPSRLLVDPRRRAFVRKQRHGGGVVVIDQSGSMSIDEAQIDEILTVAPASLVLGYSHQPGSIGMANAWSIAQDGHRMERLPNGNVGNGVDGPILQWALAKRRKGEPFVWVTDGQVTDSNDHPDTALSAICAELVIRHSIRMVKSISDIPGALIARNRPKYTDFGRVGAEINKVLSR